MLEIRKPIAWFLFTLIAFGLLLTSACASPALTPTQPQGQAATAVPMTGGITTPRLISVVAAENFYGNLVQQLGAIGIVETEFVTGTRFNPVCHLGILA